MTILPLALFVGLVAGIVTGGRPRNVAARSVRATLALGAGIVLQAVPRLFDVGATAGLACVIASYVLLVAFAARNIRLVGMPIIFLGLALNLAVIVANAGMPVRFDAIATVDRDRSAQEIRELQFDAKRHLERPDDRITVLGDVLPIRPAHEVISFGDLILAVGLADVVFRLLHPLTAPRRRERTPAARALVMG
jgi:hypothetical protein